MQMKMLVKDLGIVEFMKDSPSTTPRDTELVAALLEETVVDAIAIVNGFGQEIDAYVDLANKTKKLEDLEMKLLGDEEHEGETKTATD